MLSSWHLLSLQSTGSSGMDRIMMFSRGRFCFFKQKTADERRSSDWSSDVCSSDLEKARAFTEEHGIPAYKWDVSDHEACQRGVERVHGVQAAPEARLDRKSGV